MLDYTVKIAFNFETFSEYIRISRIGVLILKWTEPYAKIIKTYFHQINLSNFSRNGTIIIWRYDGRIKSVINCINGWTVEILPTTSAIASIATSRRCLSVWVSTGKSDQLSINRGVYDNILKYYNPIIIWKLICWRCLVHHILTVNFEFILIVFYIVYFSIRNY